MKASQLKIGQKVMVSYSHEMVMGGKEQTSTGTVVDHFGDGVFITLDKPLRAFDEAAEGRNAGNYGHLTSHSEYCLDSFEYFDGEENECTVTAIK